MSIDSTRRNLATAKRAPQWQRLIRTVHDAQERAGYAGRQFGESEMRYFGAELVGFPQATATHSSLAEYAVYWVERQSLEHGDGSVSVRYALRAVRGDDFARVETIADEWLPDGWATEHDDATAADFARRAAFQAGAIR